MTILIWVENFEKSICLNDGSRDLGIQIDRGTRNGKVLGMRDVLMRAGSIGGSTRQEVEVGR